MPRQVDGVVNKTRRRSSLWITRTTVERVVARCRKCITLRSTVNPLTPLLRFVLDFSYKLFLHCFAAVDKILTDTSRRAVRLRSQSFLSTRLFCDSFSCIMCLNVLRVKMILPACEVFACQHFRAVRFLGCNNAHRCVTHGGVTQGDSDVILFHIYAS